MRNTPTMIIALFVALTFSLGLPVFAEQEAAQPAGQASASHMVTSDAATTKEATPETAPKAQKTKKKKMAKKAKKSHKDMEDAS